MSHRRILLLGRDGQVGYELQRTFAPLGTVAAYGRDRADLSNLDALRRLIQEEVPHVIVNAAAYTAVDRAESEPDLARTINAEAPGLLAEEAKRVGALLVHYSTDYVYDGAKGAPYAEGDETNPINTYGRTKLEGDEAIQALGGQYLILRTSWVYAARGRNFLLTILRLAREREELRIVEDQVGCPTWSRWIAEVSAHVTSEALRRGEPADASGVYHLSAGGEATWYDFACAILDHARRVPGIDLSVRDVVPISSAEYPTPAARPAYSVLSKDRLQRTFGLAVTAWQEQLALCMADLAFGIKA